MSAQERSNIISRVEETQRGKRKILTQLQVPKSTYYRWRARALQGKQDSSTSSTRIPWNKLSPPEEATVLAAARESPEWSSRQLATWITDYLRLSVGESTVYRLLKREELVKPPEMQLVAGKEYQRKTSGPHQMWATDASYFRVVGWGYYYMVTMVTVMDDYSRSILAWKLQRDMSADSLIQVVQLAIDATGMTDPNQDDGAPPITRWSCSWSAMNQLRQFVHKMSTNSRRWDHTGRIGQGNLDTICQPG